MADRIDNLPSSKEDPSEIDINVMKDIFGKMSETKSFNFKALIIPIIIFLVLSLSVTDTVMRNLISDSDVTILAVKTIIFIAVLVLVQISN
jgi:hypothetical protein